MRWHPQGAETARDFYEWLAEVCEGDLRLAALRARAADALRSMDLVEPAAGFIDAASCFALIRDVAVLGMRARLELRSPSGVSERIVAAFADDFARLADRADALCEFATSRERNDEALRRGDRTARAALETERARLAGGLLRLSAAQGIRALPETLDPLAIALAWLERPQPLPSRANTRET